MARARAREEWARRRERRIYARLAARLLVLGAVVVRSRGGTDTLPVTPSTRALAQASSAAVGASARAQLTANVPQAEQIST